MLSYKEFKFKFDNLFSFDSNTFLSQIQSKLNDTNNIIEEYNSHFSSFKISQEVNKFLDNLQNSLDICDKVWYNPCHIETATLPRVLPLNSPLNAGS